MSIKRVVTSINASFNQFVNKVENHEAVADSLIYDIKQSAAGVKMQLSKTKARQNQLDERILSTKDSIDKWQRRALEYKTSDRQKALNCVRYMEEKKQSLSMLNKQSSTLAKVESELLSNLNFIEDKLFSLQQKRESLSARSAKNCSMQSINLDDKNHEVFERWETQVLADEYIEHYSEHDSFEKDFEREEQQHNLEAILDELSSEKKEKK